MINQHLRLAVIGGGASGTLAAIHLLRQSAPRVVHLFNDGFELGRGVAYSSACDQLLLNVPAARMSAFPDLPSHFVDWLKERHGTRFTGDSFVPRQFFGDYLRENLEEAASKATAGRLQLHAGRASEILRRKSGYAVVWDNQETEVDGVVLALGNVPPANPVLGDNRFVADPRYISSPWHEAGKLQRVANDESVVIVGSSLTAVDTVLQLREQGHRGEIVLISRRGQWPSVHRLGLAPISQDAMSLVGRGPAELTRLVRDQIRQVEEMGGDWRQVIDGLRPATNAIWAGWSLRERQSFLCHMRSYWDVRRHRMAPEVWARVQDEMSQGTLRLIAARVTEIRTEVDGLEVTYRPRCQSDPKTLRADVLINCTGSESLRRQCCQPVVRSLLEQHLAVLDPLGLGLMASPDGHLTSPRGGNTRALMAVGPVRRGNLWETTAIPEIRVQAKDVAAQLVGELVKSREQKNRRKLVDPYPNS